MAFILSKKESYSWPVKYKMPKDGGKYETVEFLAEFRRLPQSRLDELIRLARKGDINDDMFVDEVMLGWSGIKTPVEGLDGKSEFAEFEYSQANKVALLDMFSGMRGAIVLAFNESITGIATKN